MTKFTDRLTDRECELLLAARPKPHQLVYIYFPDASEEFAEWLLWERTPFPLERGVRDLADRLCALAVDGPRCGEFLPNGTCRRKVRDWGAYCYQHAMPSDEHASPNEHVAARLANEAAAV